MDVLHDQMQGRPFHILAVNVQENRETVDAFVSDYGYRFPVLLDQSGRVAANYSVRGIPTSYFISPGGRVLGILVGTRYWDEPDVLAAMEQIAGLAEAAQR